MALIILYIIKDFQLKSISKIYFPLEIGVAFGFILDWKHQPCQLYSGRSNTFSPWFTV